MYRTASTVLCQVSYNKDLKRDVTHSSSVTPYRLRSSQTAIVFEQKETNQRQTAR